MISSSSHIPWLSRQRLEWERLRPSAIEMIRERSSLPSTSGGGPRSTWVRTAPWPLGQAVEERTPSLSLARVDGDIPVVPLLVPRRPFFPVSWAVAATFAALLLLLIITLMRSFS